MAKVQVKIFTASINVDYETLEDVENIKDFMAKMQEGMAGKNGSLSMRRTGQLQFKLIILM